MTKFVNLNLRFWIELGLFASFVRLVDFGRDKSAFFHLTHSRGAIAGREEIDYQWFIVAKYDVNLSNWFFAAYDHFSFNFTSFHTISQPQGADFSPVTRFTGVN